MADAKTASVAKESLMKSPTKIMDRIEARASFHENRKRALETPELARDQLAEWATLEIKVEQAVNLEAADFNFLSEHSSDPYVKVLVDDCERAESNVVKQNCSPTWNWSTEVKISAATDVVQLQVMDHDMASAHDLIGFTEFGVADLPLGKPVKGWFSLTSKDRLQGSAKQRLQKAKEKKDLDLNSKEGEVAHTGSSGNLLVELCLKPVSGDGSDEFFAFCLPERPGKVYPATGFKRPHEPMDAQGLYDVLERLAMILKDSWVLPVVSFVEYVVTWRDVAVSATYTTCAVFVVLFPMFIVPVLAGIHGFFFLLTRTEESRKKIFLSPYSVSLSDEGYESVAALQSSEKMLAFLERLVKGMHGEVVDRERLRDFATFAQENGRPVTDIAGLKAQLRETSKMSKPFIKVPDEPMKAGTLVMCLSSGRTGEIKECKNPKVTPPRRYMVSLAVTKGAPELVECLGDSLEIRQDMRWLSRDVVLALIPDSIEDMVNELRPPVETVVVQLELVTQQLYDIIAWKSGLTQYITAGLFGVAAVFALLVGAGEGILSLLLIWVVKLAVAVAVLVPHIWFASFVVKVRTKKMAESLAREHEEKDPFKAWPWFVENQPAPVVDGLV